METRFGQTGVLLRRVDDAIYIDETSAWANWFSKEAAITVYRFKTERDAIIFKLTYSHIWIDAKRGIF